MPSTEAAAAVDELVAAHNATVQWYSPERYRRFVRQLRARYTNVRWDAQSTKGVDIDSVTLERVFGIYRDQQMPTNEKKVQLTHILRELMMRYNSEETARFVLKRCEHHYRQWRRHLPRLPGHLDERVGLALVRLKRATGVFLRVDYLLTDDMDAFDRDAILAFVTEHARHRKRKRTQCQNIRQ